MKSIFSILITLLLIFTTSCTPKTESSVPAIESDSIEEISPVKLLRHVVMFKFKEDASPDGIKAVEEAFNALPSKISEIADYEWGTNNSPEGLDKGFTHIFFVSFKSEEDRAIYLPHPDHKAFVTVLEPVLEDVLVLDYWTTD